jgi:DNA-directed RNA polymerase subunit RPC12/RpoP
LECPHCGERVYEVNRNRFTKLEWDSSISKWVESDVVLDRISCTHCAGEISYDELEEAGMPIREE